MSILPGSRLGPYEVISPLGVGGMGQVFKARDTRLDRSVAIKVLPAEFAADPQLKIRFEREAKTISQLSHPHICTLYDVGDGFLVMELLEGETLADKTAKGPLPLDQVLRYGIEIAEALDKAHKAAVVHRDLKPANVMITKSGAKLLDFGLAKTRSVVDFDGATQQKALTKEGAILGTFQYMAPEQLEGIEADARTDIFAFGTVLYEMATGKRAFEGKTKTSLIAAIVSGEPKPLRATQPLTPPAFEHVVAKCLAKDPEDRWQSAHDVAEELRWIRDVAQAQTSGAPRRTSKATVASAFLGGALIATIAVFALRNRFVPQRPTTQLTIPITIPLAATATPTIAIAPSGRTVAFIGDRDGVTQLCLRRLGSLDAFAVPGTDGATSPFFSYDSRWVAFGAGRSLMKMPVEGGTPQQICEAADIRGASWRGDLIAFAMGTSGVWVVPAAGGKPRLIVPPNQIAGENLVMYPELLPGNRHVLYASFHGMQPGIEAISLQNGKRTLLMAEGSNPRYINGCLLFSRGPSLFAVRFDPERLRLIGPPISVVSDINTTINGDTLFAVAEDGTLAYVRGTEAKLSLVWVDSASGRVTPIPVAEEAYEEPRLSSDGNRAAVTVRKTENTDIWNADLVANTLTRVTFDPGEDETAVWSRDSMRIAFAASRAGHPRSMYWRRADGIGGEEQLLSSPPLDGHPHLGDFSPDGMWLAYTNYDPASGGDIWVMSMIGGKSQPFVRTPFNERAPRFSPDGKFIAYTSNESGRDEVYVQSFPGPGGRWQVSSDGGSEVVWARDGKGLSYRSGDKMMVVAVNTGNSFSFGRPRLLFTGTFAPTLRGEAAYDVTADGKRFLMLQRDQSGPAPQLVVALDWFTELENRIQRASENQ